MRVTTAFNKMLALPGASVTSVAFAPEGIVVSIRNRRHRLRCPCGFSTAARYDSSVRRWRHVDLGNCRLWLEGEIRRLDCGRCRLVRTEEVPWARRELGTLATSKTSSPGWCSAPTRRRRRH